MICYLLNSYWIALDRIGSRRIKGLKLYLRFFNIRDNRERQMFIVLRVNICFSWTSLFYFDLSLERICMQKNLPCHVIRSERWKAIVELKISRQTSNMKRTVWEKDRTMWDQLPNTPIECGIFYRFMLVSQNVMDF